MSLDLTGDELTLVQVMAWCRQVTSHFPRQCRPRSISSYGVARSHWVNGYRQFLFNWHRGNHTTIEWLPQCLPGKPEECGYITTTDHSDPDSKVHGTNMGPTWVLSVSDGPHVGPMNLGVRGSARRVRISWNVLFVFNFYDPNAIIRL